MLFFYVILRKRSVNLTDLFQKKKKDKTTNYEENKK